MRMGRHKYQADITTQETREAECSWSHASLGSRLSIFSCHGSNLAQVRGEAKLMSYSRDDVEKG